MQTQSLREMGNSTVQWNGEDSQPGWKEEGSEGLHIVAWMKPAHVSGTCLDFSCFNQTYWVNLCSSIMNSFTWTVPWAGPPCCDLFSYLFSRTYCYFSVALALFLLCEIQFTLQPNIVLIYQKTVSQEAQICSHEWYKVQASEFRKFNLWKRNCRVLKRQCLPCSCNYLLQVLPFFF